MVYIEVAVSLLLMILLNTSWGSVYKYVAIHADGNYMNGDEIVVMAKSITSCILLGYVAEHRIVRRV